VSISVEDLALYVAESSDAEGMVEVIRAAFGARPPLEPPSTAADETPESIRDLLAHGGSAIYATVAGSPAGVILISTAAPELARFSRVSVHPGFQRHGIASAMVTAAEDHAAERGYRTAELFAREELGELISFWLRRGYCVARQVPHGVMLAKTLPLAILVPTADEMRRLGVRLSGILEPGDLVVAAGELGAGKTTLAQGVGQGLDSEGPIISPTFVLSRMHRSTSGKPDLLHVDAYRLSSGAELEDLDLDEHVAHAITFVEWGTGLAEGLAENRLEIDIRTTADSWPGANGDARLVLIRAVGSRWQQVDLKSLEDPSPIGPDRQGVRN